jgi:hypothetical protein
MPVILVKVAETLDELLVRTYSGLGTDALKVVHNAVLKANPHLTEGTLTPNSFLFVPDLASRASGIEVSHSEAWIGLTKRNLQLTGDMLQRDLLSSLEELNELLRLVQNPPVSISNLLSTKEQLKQLDELTSSLSEEIKAKEDALDFAKTQIPSFINDLAES